MHAVTALLFAHDCDIVEHQQFDDPIRDGCSMRTEFVSAQEVDTAELPPLWAAKGEDVGAHPAALSSALDDVESEAAPGRLLVLVLHVSPSLTHGLYRLVQGDVVASVTAYC